jgi:Mrp family chromosome partitioning ATPase
MSEPSGLDLPKLLALLKARAGLLAAITLGAAALALVVSLAQPERFKATSVLLFGGAPRAEILLEGGTNDSGSTDVQQAAATNVALASLDSVAARVKQRLGTPASVQELRDAMNIQAEGESSLVDLTADWRTADGAALLATTFGEEVVALRREMAQAEIQRAIEALNQTIAGAGGDAAQVAPLKQRVSQLQLLKAVQTGDVRLAERAVPPQSASAPRPVFNAIAAGLVALLLGLGGVVLFARLDTRIHDEGELTALISAPVLARIPEVARPRRFIPFGARGEESSFLEAIQFLRLNVQRTRPPGQGVVVAVTSPLAGDGKTMVVAWLAQSLAFNEAEVLAVDSDLRSPMLHTYFDARDELGGMLPNLRLVGPGDHAALPVGLSGQAPMREMFDELRDKADYVVVDTSPVASVAHASAVCAAADEVILVIDLGRIRRKDLLAAKEHLANARANVIGIVLNRAVGDVAAYYPHAELIPKSDIAPSH